MLPSPIQKFIEVFSKIPSVGPRMATRLAFYFINLDKQSFKNIVSALVEIRSMDSCPNCFFIKERRQRLCPICSDKNRNRDMVAIVEKASDVISIEKTKSYNGLYLVMGEIENKGSLNTKQKLKLKQLKKRSEKFKDNKLKEVVIATSPNTNGDFVAKSVYGYMKDNSEKISRLGRGMPTGGEIEFSDEETLKNALKGRN